MNEQPNKNRPSVPSWVSIIIVFAVILGLQLLFSGRYMRNNPLSILLIIGPVLLLIWIFSRRFRQKKDSIKKNEDYDFIE